LVKWLTFEEAPKYLKMVRSNFYDLARRAKVPLTK